MRYDNYFGELLKILISVPKIRICLGPGPGSGSGSAGRIIMDCSLRPLASMLCHFLANLEGQDHHKVQMS